MDGWWIVMWSFMCCWSFLRWTPACWGVLGCWTQPPSSAALRPTRFLQCSRPPRAPRTIWSSPASSGPQTATSSWWPTMARSIASWFKPDLYLPRSSCVCHTWTVLPEEEPESCMVALFYILKCTCCPTVVWKSMKRSNCSLVKKLKTHHRSRFGLKKNYVLSPIVVIELTDKHNTVKGLDVRLVYTTTI